MKRPDLCPILILAMTAFGALGCSGSSQRLTTTPAGSFALEIDGPEAATSGILEIIGLPGDYWGRLTLHREEPRQITVLSVREQGDSLRISLPNGHLTLERKADMFVGELVWFDDSSRVRAWMTGMVSEELAALASLLPFEWGLVSTPDNEAFPAFSTDGETLYFSRFESWSHHTIMMAEQTGGQWSAPMTAPFSGIYSDRAPYPSPDGRSLLFTSNRPLPGEAEGAPGRLYHLWTVDREAGNWGAPQPLPSPVNSDSSDYHGALTRTGTVYFSSWLRPDGYGRSDLYRAKPSGGAYEVQNLGPTINSAGSESDVYVDPEERFIIFVSTDRSDTLGGDDLYISYRQDGTWTSPRNLGPPINSYSFEYGPMISPDGSYLYFTSHRRGTADIYQIELSKLLTPR